MYEPEDTVIADAAEKDIHGIATMAAHVDWHAALSEREVPSIQNPAFSRFCHAKGTPATRLTGWTALDGRDGVSSSVVLSYPVTQPQTEREEAATGFIYSDVKPTVLPLETSTDDVPVNTDSLSANPVTLVEAHDHLCLEENLD